MRTWTQPRRCHEKQQFLFCQPVDELLAGLRVSRDETLRWHNLGWLSFNVNDLDKLEQPLECELRLICSLTRSGLEDAQINTILAPLEKPYRYQFKSMAFHFDYGLVSPPPAASPFDVIEQELGDFLESLAEIGATPKLESIKNRIEQLLAPPTNNKHIDNSLFD